ncbi:MFS transporter [Paenibacillus sp. LS1]|uniref:staphylopine family metallophore export MFS transporter CntE n=1 Tax=Paenibacillus sp. LS1 TaxID=2992120 RepID=UPI002232BAD0|nr:MFS transporter [Paenibacillus sp. LS1]MCW3791569.1 MFS transporter [Paenibacillus sp. LS1]
MNRGESLADSRNGAFSPAVLRLYALTFLFYSANAFVQMILPLYTRSIGFGNDQIGMIVGTYLLVSMLLRPWAGIVVERIGIARILRYILVGHLFVLLLFVWQGNISYIIIRGLQGAVAAFFSLAVQMAVMDLVSKRDRAQGLSLYLLFGLLPSVMMPALGWIAWDKAGMNGFYTGLMVLGVLTLIASYGIGRATKHIKVTKTSAEQKATKHDIAGGVRSTLWNRHFMLSSLVMMSATIGFGAVTAFLALYVIQIGIGNAGLFFAVQSGVIVTARFAFRKNLPSDGNWHSAYVGMLLVSITIGLALVAIAPLTGKAWVLYGGGAAIGYGIANVYPVLAAYLSIVLGQERRKVWMGLFISMSDLGTVIGSLVLGMTADYTGYGDMFWISAGATLCVAVFVVLSRRWMARSSV